MAVARLGGRGVMIVAAAAWTIGAACGRSLAAGAARNDRYQLRTDGAAVVVSADGVERRFEPRVVVLRAMSNPKPELRWSELGEPNDGRPESVYYNVMTWETGKGRGAAGAVGGEKHVEDGFDPMVDRGREAGRTFDWMAAGERTTVVGTWVRVEGNRIVWVFPEGSGVGAEVSVPAGSGEPVVTVRYEPKGDGWYSVAYVGAPGVKEGEVEEAWQPLIWTEKRLPGGRYLTEAARCPLPAALVTSGGVTSGVVVDPGEMPFQPMPTVANSRFGVTVRAGEVGEVRAGVAAPILGGAGSKRKAGEAVEYKVRLLVRKGGTAGAFEHIARGVFGFRDYRSNAVCSLNTTLENTVEFAMSKWARFNDELRGAAYDTDVPGSVKNISALHPLGVALVTDDEEVYAKRARPMMEYAMSRERFLFTTDVNVKGQGASSKLGGPGVPLTEVAAMYAMTGGRTGAFLEGAKSLWGRTRSLNLDAVMRGDTWQNALALYRATGDKAWLEKAVGGAREYVKARVETRQTDYKDPDSRGMFFWTSFAPNWMELYDLYCETGEKEFLNAARAGARAFAQFVYLCPAIPEGEVLVNEEGHAPLYRNSPKFKPIPAEPERVAAWRVSEAGLTCESSGTSKGHRGILLTSFAPWMLRLGAETGDEFLRDIGRSAVVGRYASFPGYHMNTARTTAYEKPDFAWRSMAEMNSATSVHYNHIWAQVAMLVDYLVSDAHARSHGKVAFPARYAEGYAYVQSNVYGDRAGKFYGDEGVWLWMPKGLAKVGDKELNYVAARGENGLYFALTNQSAKAVETTLTVDQKLAGWEPGRRYPVRVWRENEAAASAEVVDGVVKVAVAAKGITGIAIDGLKVTPRFQGKVAGTGGGWKEGTASLKEIGGTEGMVISMGPEVTSAYVYAKANGTKFSKVTLKYAIDGKGEALEDSSYPFEWTVGVPAGAKEFSFELEGVGVDGKVEKSAAAVMRR